MRARTAYIGSFATTAILIAFALIVLAVLGGMFGFTPWPHGSSPAVAAPVAVSSHPRQIRALRTSVTRRLAAATRARAATTAGLVLVPAATAAGASTSTAGLVLVQAPAGSVDVPASGGTASSSAGSQDDLGASPAQAPTGSPQQPGLASAMTADAVSVVGTVDPQAAGEVGSAAAPATALVDALIGPRDGVRIPLPNAVRIGRSLTSRLRHSAR